MNQPTLESLKIFVEAAALGSFSAAARRLGKSQSTVSEAISGMEIDLGLPLFERGGRNLSLTEAGRQLEVHARLTLQAQEQLTNVAKRLRDGFERRLTLVVSDTYQPKRFDELLSELETKHPDFDLEFLIAEGTDVISLIRTGRAQIGLLDSQIKYPSDIRFIPTLTAETFSIYVSPAHPLASVGSCTANDLSRHRELRLNTLFERDGFSVAHRLWSAPSYLMLMDMAQQGFGWAPLPHTLVKRYSWAPLKELTVPGWPKNVVIDAVWFRDRPLGAVAQWLIKHVSTNEILQIASYG